MTTATLIYTSAVPADLTPEDIGIADARSNLTEIVNHVRLLGQMKFLTNRSRRMAVVMPAEVGELAKEFGGPEGLIAFVREAQRKA